MVPRRKEMFYLTMHSKHFMVIWRRTWGTGRPSISFPFQSERKTRCSQVGYSFQLERTNCMPIYTEGSVSSYNHPSDRIVHTTPQLNPAGLLTSKLPRPVIIMLLRLGFLALPHPAVSYRLGPGEFNLLMNHVHSEHHNY